MATDLFGIGKAVTSLTDTGKEVGSAIYNEIQPVPILIPVGVGISIGLLLFLLITKAFYPNPERWRTQQCCARNQMTTSPDGKSTTQTCAEYRPCTPNDLYSTPAVILMYFGGATMMGLVAGALAYKIAFIYKNPKLSAGIATGQAVRNIFR